MEREEIISLCKEYSIGDSFDIEGTSYTTSDFHMAKYLHHEGGNEMGFGRWVDDDQYVNCNERCDSTVKWIEHPTVFAIQANHHHRRGNVGSVTVYLKQL